jgi:hypothetical protein
MAVDNTIPQGEPGIASFSSETWGNSKDPRYGEGVLTTTHMSITASGADIELGLYTVIAEDGTIAVESSGSDAYAILAAPIVIADGATMSVPVYREGHFEQTALVWDASFDTDAKKQSAFEGSKSPTIFVSKGKHSDGAIYP